MSHSVSSDVLKAMRESYALTRELGLPNMTSEYWSNLLESGRQDYGGKGDFIADDELWASFRSNVITKGLDNANVPEEALERVQVKWRNIHRELTSVVPERLQHYFEETPVGGPRSVNHDGIPMTQSSLEYTFMLSHLEPYVEDADVVVDIGGGYGGLARLLKKRFPKLRLVLLDLPEVNAIQTYFLSTCFPEARVLTLRDVHERESIDPRALGADFLVLPGQLIERLPQGSFGLVINTRSMMEMDLPTVSFYIGHIQDKLPSGGSFYCVNRYEKKTRLKAYLCIVKTAPPTKSRTYAPLEFRAEDGETSPLCSTLLSSSSHLASVPFGRCVGAAPTWCWRTSLCGSK